MKRFNKIFKVLICLTLMMTLFACTTKDKQDGPIELVDQAKRTVVLKQPAQKIVSGYYISTYACLSLGLGDNIVGLEKKAETRPIYKMAQPELLDLPQVGTMKALNVEAAIELEPDLVILPMKLKDQVDAFEKVQIPVLVVNPENHDLLVEMLNLIGQATNHQDQAQSLIDYYEKQLTRIQSFKQTQTKVYMGSNSSFLETAPASMYQNSIIETAGGINVASDIKGDYWTKVSYETILQMNPDMIIIPANATYTKEDVLSDKQLSSLKVIQDQKVYQMPREIEEWDSPIPSGILGTMWLTSLLHESDYSFDDFKKDVKEFYQTFYQFDINESFITK